MRLSALLLLATLLLPVPALARAQAEPVLKTVAEPAHAPAATATAQEVDKAVDVTEPAVSPVDEHHKAGVPQFDPSSFAGQLLWLAISFALLYLLMSRVALPRIGRTVEARAHHIAAALQEAQSHRNATQSALTGYEAQLVMSRHEAQMLIAGAQAQADKAQTAALSAQNARITAEIQAAEARIAGAKGQALAQLAPVAAGAASQMFAKLTGNAANNAQLESTVGRILARVKGAA